MKMQLLHRLSVPCTSGIPPIPQPKMLDVRLCLGNHEIDVEARRRNADWRSKRKASPTLTGPKPRTVDRP